MRKDPVRVAEVEERRPVGVLEVVTVRTRSEETVLVDSQLSLYGTALTTEGTLLSPASAELVAKVRIVQEPTAGGTKRTFQVEPPPQNAGRVITCPLGPWNDDVTWTSAYRYSY
ncbi:hypothetical protein GCM10009741_36050 [Kribbella lupini]|uniref:Uncharacterized protein n=1 Tax=Kribbella lupini TaxID=291602 RepID=A0ABN2AZH4_9ACTN